MSNLNAPFHPIIYVRGYAMTPREIDETTADPFCGFNLGSTVYRAVASKGRPPRKYVFESPVVRLADEFKYRDVYEDGYDIMDPEWDNDPDNKLVSRSIIIFRYYDEASRLLGIGQTPPIEVFAAKLGELILKIRDLLYGNPASGVTQDDFKCYLVAHSMGGLVCRALLQNPFIDLNGARKYVDKLFTYATPHNGIDLAGINVPRWLGVDDMSNFNRARMAEYLNLGDINKDTGRVDYIPESMYPTERVFCMVGSNRMDYEVAHGISRTFSGHGSDGLVRIENATLLGLKDDGQPGVPCAKAVAFRSHSGFYGIVNSEESFQNLWRFLFGDVRVDIWMDVEDIRLPRAVKNENVNALYQFEVMAAPRGKLWYLTRRTAEEDSVACLTHEEWKKAGKACSVYLSTVFLARRAKVNFRRRSLAYSVTLGIRVPDYEVSGKLWIKEHYEGGYLYRDTIIVEIIPPSKSDEKWRIKHNSQMTIGEQASVTEIHPSSFSDGRFELPIEFNVAAEPGVKGKIRFIITPWNQDAVMDQ